MLIKVESKIYEITLKKWTPSGYTPDCFQDLETNIGTNEALNLPECSPEEFEELRNFWEQETHDEESEFLGLSEEEKARGEEWRLEVEDVTERCAYMLEE
jgi:hypothetical protein